MIAEQLRAAILQAAISGKLTDQRLSDGTAADLHRQIAEEKVYLTKAGRLKKHKPLPPIVEDERPFDIPKTWRWVHFGTVAEFNPKVVAREDTLVSFLPMACIEDGYSGVIAPESRTWGDVRTNYSRFANGDVIIAKITPCFQNRKSAVVHALENGIGAGTTELHVIRPLNGLSRRFVFWLVKSSYLIDSLVPLMTGTAGQKRVPLTALKNLPLPLPPLAEQERIVAKLDKLMPLIDQLAELEREREDLDQAFFTALEAAILQAAISGKLTDQRLEDGTAQQLASNLHLEREFLIRQGILKRPPKFRDVGRLPFDIPESWEAMPLGVVFDISSGASYKKNQQVVGRKDTYRVLRGGNISFGTVTLKPDDVHIEDASMSSSLLLRAGDILTPGVTSLSNIGKMGMLTETPERTVAGGFVFRLRSHSDSLPNVSLKCYFMFLQSSYIQTTMQGLTNKSGQAFYNLSKVSFASLILPLPPLAEQERIVAKLDAVLPLVRELQEASAYSDIA